jgi:hypothetical protein
MSVATSEHYQEPHALRRLIRYTGAFIAGASILLGCIITALIAWAVLRAQPLDFIAILALLLLVLSVCGIRRTGIFLAIIFAVSGCYFLGCVIVTTIQGQPQFSNFGWLGRPLLVLGSLSLGWLLGFMFRVFALKDTTCGAGSMGLPWLIFHQFLPCSAPEYFIICYPHIFPKH